MRHFLIITTLLIVNLHSKAQSSFEDQIEEAFNKIRSFEKSRKIEMDGGNGDGVFIAQGQQSKKWGMYQYYDDKNIEELIPMEYDSIRFFPWNAYYTAVFNDGKVGIYLSKWSYGEDAKQSIACIYDDYKRYVTDDQEPKLAVKRDGYWGWVDWLTGEEKSEFKYLLPDDLPYPYFKQAFFQADLE